MSNGHLRTFPHLYFKKMVDIEVNEYVDKNNNPHTLPIKCLGSYDKYFHTYNAQLF